MCGVCGIDECDDEFWCKVEEEIQEVGSWNIGDDDEDAAQQVLAPDRASAAQVEVLDDTRPAGAHPNDCEVDPETLPGRYADDPTSVPS